MQLTVFFRTKQLKAAQTTHWAAGQQPDAASRAATAWPQQEEKAQDLSAWRNGTDSFDQGKYGFV
jgi:hypothetical protein